jgi:hypothetical protein
MNTMNPHKELHQFSASAPQPKIEKLKPRRERRQAAREAARTSKRNELKQAIAAQTAQNNQKKFG